MIIFEDSFKCFVNNLRNDNEKEGNPRNKHSNLTQDVEKKILEVGLEDARYRKRIIIFRLEFSWRKKKRGRDCKGAEGAAYAVGKKFFSRYWKGGEGRKET